MVIIGQRIIEISQNKGEIVKSKKKSAYLKCEWYDMSLPTYTMHNYEYAFIALTTILTRQLYCYHRNYYKRVLTYFIQYLNVFTKSY